MGRKIELDETDQGMTEEEAASYLALKKATLNKWRVQGIGPAFVKVSARCIRYMKSDLAKWLAERKAHSTAEGNEKVS